MRKTNRTRSWADVSIPADVGDRFLSELVCLLEGMSKDGGFATQYQRDEMLSKYCDATTTSPAVRRQRAIEKWLRTEQRNARTNQRVMLGLTLEHDFGFADWETVRSETRAIIERVLGPIEYPAILQKAVPTNGASTRVRRSPAAAVHKLSGEAHISSAAVKHWVAAFSCTRISAQNLQLVEYSGLFTVPKKTDIDRVAAKEPECNMLLQRSVGIHIRERLKRFGIDLLDQTQNQELARQAVGLNLATLDLSSASDSITRQVVLELLPLEWFELLDDLRVRGTKISSEEGSQLHEFEMFSSMGNGFTFELESLIFYALVRAIQRVSLLNPLGRERRSSDARSHSFGGRIAVYGDDIICPAGLVRRVQAVFGFLGFLLNPEKTHTRGLFRESCGAHWYGGRNVKPFYVRGAVRELPDIIRILNRLLEWDGRGWGFFTTPEALNFWLTWKAVVPKRLWGGIDPEDPTCLVTGHAPRQRLVPHMVKKRVSGEASLTLWLLARDRCGSPKADLFVDGYLAVDPKDVAGWKYQTVVSRGARTSWMPDVAFAS